MTANDVRNARNLLRLSQAALADRLGVDVKTVSRWELGKRSVPPFLRLALEHLACIDRERAERALLMPSSDAESAH